MTAVFAIVNDYQAPNDENSATEIIKLWATEELALNHLASLCDQYGGQMREDGTYFEAEDHTLESDIYYVTEWTVYEA